MSKHVWVKERLVGQFYIVQHSGLMGGTCEEDAVCFGALIVGGGGGVGG